jgi:hypothetical protein
MFLTAAHLVADSTGTVDVFGLETADLIDLIDYQRVAVYPSYRGDLFAANHRAVVRLSRLAPAGANRYAHIPRR